MMTMTLHSTMFKIRKWIIQLTISRYLVIIKEYKKIATSPLFLVFTLNNLNRTEILTKWLIRGLMRQSRWFPVSRIMMIIVIWILERSLGRRKSINLTWLRDNLIRRLLFKTPKTFLILKKLKNIKFWSKNKLNFLKSFIKMEVYN